MSFSNPIAFVPSGRPVRCIALDPDGLLWEGVLGEDGVEGIRAGGHTDLQVSLKTLAQSGIRLALISRNSADDVLGAFERLSGMALGRDDIGIFEPSWNGKAEALSVIRDRLRIRLDEMVYLDADPFQRGLAASTLPGIMTDAQAFPSAGEFLDSLGMQMVVRRFETVRLTPVAELLRRSSQYHLTARAYTRHDCEALAGDPDVLPLYAVLRDRLCDYGPVAAVVLSAQGEEMIIHDWGMTARILDRGVEHELMNLVVSLAQSRGCTRLSADYVRTAKNGAVSDFYAQFGFTMVGEEPDHSLWVLPLMAYEPFPVSISSTATFA